MSPEGPAAPVGAEKLGQTFTKPAVARVLLDVAGYLPTDETLKYQLCEPSAGDGAIVSVVVEQLLAAARGYGIGPRGLANCVRAYELDPGVFSQLKDRIHTILRSGGVDSSAADYLVRSWLLQGDFLLARPDQAQWVVGNPPYIRARHVERARRTEYRSRWTTMTAGADIYVAFIEAGLDCLDTSGTLTYLCPDNWMRNDFGRSLRNVVAPEYSIRDHYTFVGESPFTSSVGAYPAIFSIRRGPQTSLTYGVVHVGRDQDGSKATATRTEEGTLQAGDAVAALKCHYWPRFSDAPDPTPSTFETLADVGVTVRTGLASGCDRVFVLDRAEASRLGLEPEVLIPACHARDLAAMVAGSTPADVLLDPSRIRWGDPKTARAEQYLRDHRELLTRRRTSTFVAGQETWRLIDRVRDEDLGVPKLGIPDIRGHVEVFRIDAGVVPLHGVTYLISNTWDLDVLGGVMISSVVARQVSRISPVLSGGHFRTSGQYVKQVRIPKFSDLTELQRKRLAAAYLSQDRAAADAVLSANY